MTLRQGRRKSCKSYLFFCVFGIVLGSSAVGSTAAPLAAQVAPADSAAVLLATAATFEREGRWEVAEALYELITERYGGTPAATEARARLNASPEDRLERVSRAELQVFGTLYGLWLGVAVPQAFGAEEPEAYGAGLLIGGPLGLFGSRAAIRARQYSEGQARAISWGGIWGSWQGYGWTELLNLGEEQFCDFSGCYGSGGNDEELFAAAVLGGLSGIAVGAAIARNPVRSGVSSAAQGASTWGAIYGAMGAVVIDENSDDGPLASALIVGNLGLFAGAALAGKYDVSRSRVRVINLGALVGLVGGFGIDLLVQPDEEEAVIGIPLIASMAGMGIAINATKGNRGGGLGSGDDLGGSLFAYRDGHLALGTPLPIPALLPFEGPSGRPSWRPGITVELFKAKF